MAMLQALTLSLLLLSGVTAIYSLADSFGEVLE